jgi:ankyrin repeat protein
MNMKEINYQNPIDGNTVLHEATQFGFIDIIKILLNFNATRSLYNNDGKRSFDLAQTDDIRQYFQRPDSDFRFLFVSKNSLSKSSNGRDIKCKSCSLINDQSLYEWELVDDLDYQNALRLRDELKPQTFKNVLEKLFFP